jgi:predicted enzyme related to lactoylglutathione lyase
VSRLPDTTTTVVVGPPGWIREQRSNRGEVTPMKIENQVVVFDAADLTAESTFWAGVLDGTVDAEDDWHMVLVDGAPAIGVQLAPNHVPPEWPHGTPQQIHLDLWVEDITRAHDKVMALGARVLKPAADTESADNFQVYADPAGHPFCLCWVKRP